MPVPSPRNSILPARGNYADLSSNLASLTEGEICYALDQDKLYVKEGGVLVAVSGAVDTVNGQSGTVVLDADDIDDSLTLHKFATSAQLTAADNAIQPTDSIDSLSDVDTTTVAPTDGQVLKWDNGAGQWEPANAGGAAGGGSDQVFYENDNTVTTDYSITANRNAISAGPITVNSGVTVTIPATSNWVIV